MSTETIASPAPKPSKTADPSKLARALLGRALGFRDCLGSTLDSLVEAGRISSFKKREVVAHHGASFDYVCLVMEGSLEASLTRSDGHRHLFNFLQPGDVAGLISILDGLGNVTDLRAKGPTTLMLIPGDAVRRIRTQDHRLVNAFELQLTFRSRLIYERLASDPSLAMEVRLARLLQTLAGLYGLPRGNEILLGMKISQADLADWLGASRQRINYVVQNLQKDGLIEIHYSSIKIINPAGLTALASL